MPWFGMPHGQFYLLDRSQVFWPFLPWPWCRTNVRGSVSIESLFLLGFRMTTLILCTLSCQYMKTTLQSSLDHLFVWPDSLRFCSCQQCTYLTCKSFKATALGKLGFLRIFQNMGITCNMQASGISPLTSLPVIPVSFIRLCLVWLWKFCPHSLLLPNTVYLLSLGCASVWVGSFSHWLSWVLGMILF